MFSFFKKKKSPKDDFREALLSTFNELRKADKLYGIERSMKTVFALASLAIAIREAHPQIPIDPDGLAVSIARPPESREENSAYEDAIEHILHQVRTCPNDDEMRMTIMAYFLSPSYVERKMQELSE